MFKFLGKIKQGLSKTRKKISENFSNIFRPCRVDQALLDELTDALILADVGVTTTNKIVEGLKKAKFDKDVTEDEIRLELVKIIEDIIKISEKKISWKTENSEPTVLLMVGVNGNGKTTSLGKIANKLVAEGKKTLLVACDTFRAAAVEQLEIWAKRSGAEFFSGEENADPASVAYKALEYGKSHNFDVILIDTAGRLHNKTQLMDELQKIIRVIKKISMSYPSEIILTIDATTGQNALNQVQVFNEACTLTGLIVTKLDGTAKGGMIIQLSDLYKFAIYGLGVGEAINDLQDFVARDFAESLFMREENEL